MNIELQSKINIPALINIAKNNKYTIFGADNSAKNLNLNIWVVRAANQHAGKFDDILIAFWKFNGIWSELVISCTADPSDLSLIEKKHYLGCAILMPGQWNKCWKLGMHRGKYPALVQNKPVTVIRDFNKDGILDWHIPKLYDSKTVRADSQGIITDYYLDRVMIFRTHHGMHGINNHRASQWNILESIGLYSQGCVVVQRPADWIKYYKLLAEASLLWGDEFTITLIREEELWGQRVG